MNRRILVTCVALAWSLLGGCASTPDPVKPQPRQPQPRQPQPRQPAPPPAVTATPTPPLKAAPVAAAPPTCAVKLGNLLSQKQTLYWIINDGTADRCASFTVRRKTLVHSRMFDGVDWIRWRGIYRAELHFAQNGATLTTTWKNGGSSKLLSHCGRFGGIGMRSGMRLKPPVCGAPMVVKTCKGDTWRLAQGSLFLTKPACESALAKNEPRVEMGWCQKRLIDQYAKARQPPRFAKAVTSAATRLKTVLDKRTSVYWTNPYGKFLCHRWKLERKPKTPTAFRLSRAFRRRKAKVTITHNLTLSGLDLFVERPLTRSTGPMGYGWSGPRGTCYRVVTASRHTIQLQNKLSLFTNRSACLRAKRAAAKATKRKLTP